MDTRPIGFFDSGLGGLSVLREARKILTTENFIFFGDNKNAPYGDKTREEVAKLSAASTDFLIAKGVKTIVLACNTATAAYIKELRSNLTMPVISVEPAIKPACEVEGSGKILMLATHATTKLERYAKLQARMPNPERVINIPCPGLVERIESGVFDVRRFDDLLSDFLKPYYGMQIDGIVLGCTHYVFIGEAIREFALRHFKGECKLYDGGAGTARQLKRILKQYELENRSGNGSIQFYTSGDENFYKPLFEKLMKL